jgi:anti-sigma factor RsiW
MSPHACEAFAAELVAYLDGEQPQSERARIEAHAGTCLACRRELERLAELKAMVARLPRVQPSPAFETGFWRRLDDDPVPLARRRGPRVVALPALAAAAVIALVLYSWLRPAAQSPLPSAPGREQAAAPRSGAPSETLARGEDLADDAAIDAQLADSAPADVPPELLEHSELFLRYPVVRRLEKLDHFEEVRRYGNAEPADELSPRADEGSVG